MAYSGLLAVTVVLYVECWCAIHSRPSVTYLRGSGHTHVGLLKVHYGVVVRFFCFLKILWVSRIYIPANRLGLNLLKCCAFCHLPRARLGIHRPCSVGHILGLVAVFVLLLSLCFTSSMLHWVLRLIHKRGMDMMMISKRSEQDSVAGSNQLEEGPCPCTSCTVTFATSSTKTKARLQLGMGLNEKAWAAF